jgi:hypothetical protein
VNASIHQVKRLGGLSNSAWAFRTGIRAKGDPLEDLQDKEAARIASCVESQAGAGTTFLVWILGVAAPILTFTASPISARESATMHPLSLKRMNGLRWKTPTFGNQMPQLWSAPESSLTI